MKTSEDHVVILIKIVATVALIALILLTSCAPAKQSETVPNPIANAVEMGRALGCVFAGCDGDSEHREFQREFEKIDGSSAPKK
jgi:uncharacterized membrane protein YbjE (DUF340 family)